MNTISVSYKMIIDHMISFDTRKFPNTEFTSLSKIALKIEEANTNFLNNSLKIVEANMNIKKIA